MYKRQIQHHGLAGRGGTLGLVKFQPELPLSCRVDGGHPVSYTHLDVYKRQLQSHALCVVAGRAGDHALFALLPRELADLIIDVYKRQLLASSPNRGALGRKGNLQGFMQRQSRPY